MKKKWSPEIVATVWNRINPKRTISHTFIYDLIKKHRHEWQKYLIYKGKKHTKPLHHAKVSAIPDRVDISERPDIINNCERIGDIENRNKILRQFLPKKTNFDLIPEETIATIQKSINNRLLKLLN